MGKSGGRLLPYSVIKAATCGDPIAMQKVLKHFEVYISNLCRRPYYDSNGKEGVQIDEDMKSVLERELIYAILFNFKAKEYEDS